VSIRSEPQRPYAGPLLSKEHLRGEAGLDTAVSHVFPYNGTELVAGRQLPLAAAFATSAQIPLHTSLPDAMAGRAPVSALIHAATMVTAVAYLIARMHRVLERAPTAGDVAAIVGGPSLLTAASIARVVTDVVGVYLSPHCPASNPMHAGQPIALAGTHEDQEGEPLCP
jgi:hypothetical protein